MIKIQLFSDGGTFTNKKIAISVGLMYVNKKKVLSCVKMNYNKSSDFAELFAINKLLSRALGYCKQTDIFNKKFHIEIYTDSLTSISSILSNKEIEISNKRDQLLYEIRDTLSKFNNNVSFYHIKSHISGKQLKTSHKMFCKKNNINIPFDDFLFIYQQNKKCDNIIAKEFKKYHKQKQIEKSVLLNTKNKFVTDNIL